MVARAVRARSPDRALRDLRTMPNSAPFGSGYAG
jgi:hypothetical protein